MGLYNYLHAEVECPGCSARFIDGFEFKTGMLELACYSLGDEIHWVKGKSIKHGGRPLNGEADVVGYGECPNCGLPVWLSIAIRNDRIVGLHVNKNYDPGTR